MKKQYATITFVQEEQANEAYEIYKNKSLVDVVDYLSQWDYGDERLDWRDLPPWGSQDRIFRMGPYVLSYDPGLPYFGLTLVREVEG